jgi:hypothetical protein
VTRRTEPLRLQRRLLRVEPLTPREAQQIADERPRTRADCVDGERPCPWSSCRFHRAIEVTSRGSIVYVQSEVDPWDLPDSCLLDIVDRGDPLTQDDVAQLLDLTRARVGQLERVGLLQMRAGLEGFAPGQPCAVCARRAEAFLPACPRHLEAFGRSRLAYAVVEKRVALATAWSAWVDSQ